MELSLPPLMLLVDDFADARELYAESFAFRGYRMITAGSGAEALDVARRPETPALILMDLALGGGVSGTDVMLTLRRDPAFAAVPIIAFTARALRNEQDEALLAGFDAVIPKPCLPDDLMRLIQPFLDGRTAA